MDLTFPAGMDGEAIFFTGRGGEGQGQKSMGREAPSPPLPTVRGGEGVKICGAGRGKAKNLWGGASSPAY